MNQNAPRPLGESKILSIAAAVSPKLSYPTVDEVSELFAQYERENPELVRSIRIGTSRLGEPIRMSSVGDGKRHALVVAGVHPNEPVGFLTAIELLRLLVREPEIRSAHGYTWHIVQNMDPDGVRLNEGWFRAPGDRALYARHFYRPAPESQPEWTFPTRYKTAYFDRTLPEALAVARVIEELRPELYVTLHNSETGGAYWFIEDSDESLIGTFHRLAERVDVPVDEGEGESPELKKLATGVYGASLFADHYEAAAKRGEDPAAGFCGSSSNEYAAARGARTMIPEVPYWRPMDASVADTDEPYGTMILRTSNMMAGVASELSEILTRVERDATLSTPLIDAARAFIPIMTEDATTDHQRAAVEAEQGTRYATNAETAGRETRVRSFALRYGGTLRRALEVERLAGTASPELLTALAQLNQFFDRWLERGDPVETAPIPVHSLVGVQLGSVLAFADSVALARTEG